jgi:hypothetical protein
VIDLLLIHPPVALPCEPSLATGILAAELRRRGLVVEVIDANVEALEALVRAVPADRAVTTAERRALRSRDRALQQLRSSSGYAVLDRYRAAVHDLGIALALASPSGGAVRIGLADYHDDAHSPLSTADLRAAAAAPERSPFATFFDELTLRVAERQPRLVGLSVNYLHQALPALALAGALRRRMPALRLLLGGALVGAWRGRLAPDALRPQVTEIVFGDGTPSLLAALGGQAGDHPPAPPDYSGLPWNRYLAPRRIVPFAASRGCVWGRCRYCPEAATGEPFAALDAGRLPPLLDELRSSSEAELLHLTDSALPLAALRVLSEQRWSARWYGFTRFYPELVDRTLATALRRSGCVMLQLGLESGSRRVLGRLRKGIDLDHASTALRHLSDAGVAVYLYVMLGIPGETRDDALRTLEFIAAHAPYVRYLNTSLLNLPVGSPAEPDLRLVPFAAGNDLTLYSGFAHATGWDRRTARRFLERELSRHAAIAPILRQTPPVFGANHAPFFERW